MAKWNDTHTCTMHFKITLYFNNPINFSRFSTFDFLGENSSQQMFYWRGRTSMLSVNGLFSICFVWTISYLHGNPFIGIHDLCFALPLSHFLIDVYIYIMSPLVFWLFVGFLFVCCFCVLVLVFFFLGGGLRVAISMVNTPRQVWFISRYLLLLTCCWVSDSVIDNTSVYLYLK